MKHVQYNMGVYQNKHLKICFCILEYYTSNATILIPFIQIQHLNSTVKSVTSYLMEYGGFYTKKVIKKYLSIYVKY